MERCVFCGDAIQEHQYRHKFTIFLPQEIHGNTLVIAARSMEALVHPQCAVHYGKEIVKGGATMLTQETTRSEWQGSLQSYLDSL